MLPYILPITGIILGLVIIIQREYVGDLFGETKWIHDHGGIYAWMVCLGTFISFWSAAELFGITYYVFWPLRAILPGLPQPQTDVFIP
jgi:hypothetical protein